MDFKTEIGRELLSAATSAREGRAGRLIWAGAISNGLTLLAFIGLIGNVDDPDAALQLLLWPLTIYVTGVVFGGYAGRFFAQQADIDLELATNTAVMEAIQPALTSNDVHSLHGAGRLVAGRVPIEYGPAPADVVMARSKIIRAVEKLNERTEHLNHRRKVLARLTDAALLLSMLSLLAGTSLITWHIERGDRLQPVNEPPPPAAQTTAVSPPTSPSGPAATSPTPSPPPETPAPPTRKSEPQGAASQPAAAGKGGHG